VYICSTLIAGLISASFLHRVSLAWSQILICHVLCFSSSEIAQDSRCFFCHTYKDEIPYILMCFPLLRIHLRLCSVPLRLHLAFEVFEEQIIICIFVFITLKMIQAHSRKRILVQKSVLSQIRRI